MFAATTNEIGPGRTSRTHTHTLSLTHIRFPPPTHSHTDRELEGEKTERETELAWEAFRPSRVRQPSMTTVNSGKEQFPQNVVYSQAKYPWLTAEPLVNWLTAGRACLSNYAGRHCERIWIMSILPWWLPWKTDYSRPGTVVPLQYRTLSGS